MAAISVTAASVVWASGPREAGTAGEAFTAGAILYRAATGKWLKAQSDGTSVQAGEYGLGLALFTADAADAQGQVATYGAIVTFNAALTAAIGYWLHGTAGSFTATIADVASTNYYTYVGIGRSTTSLLFVPIYSGIVLA